MMNSQLTSLCSIPIQKGEVIKVYSAPATIVYATSLVEVLGPTIFTTGYFTYDQKYSLSK